VLARVDPQALLFMPGSAGFDANGWVATFWAQYLEAGGGKRAQAAAVHTYLTDGTPMKGVEQVRGSGDTRWHGGDRQAQSTSVGPLLVDLH
jgi:hypothetical protein